MGMKATQLLENLGQSLWLDNITRDLLNTGTLKRYIDELSVTGLTSNPTIFEHAISKSKSYDAEIGHLLSTGLSGEELFFQLALQDLQRAGETEMRRRYGAEGIRLSRLAHGLVAGLGGLQIGGQ